MRRQDVVSESGLDSTIQSLIETTDKHNHSCMGIPYRALQVGCQKQQAIGSV